MQGGATPPPAARCTAAAPRGGATAPGRGAQEQRQARLVEEIRAGRTNTTWAWTRHPDEPRGLGATGHVHGFNDPLMDCRACKCASGPTSSSRTTRGAETGDGWTNAELKAYINEHDIVLPGLRQEGLHRHPPVQPHVQDPPGRDREPRPTKFHLRPRRRRASLSISRTSMRTTRAKSSPRALPDRQVLPQRDHPRQLHLPRARVRADGAGVLLQARRGP